MQRALLIVSLVVAGCRASSAEGELVVGSKHKVLTTDRGPVHVFTPDGYEAQTAGVLLYVHGYYTDVDEAWRAHDLAAQFSASRRNAVFIAMEAPIGDEQNVRWPNLRELLDAVQQSGVMIPQGPRVAVAHSGGYRTVTEWLEEGLLTDIVLLDGLYGSENALGRWLDEGQRQLVLVGGHTTERIDAFTELRGGALEVNDIPGAAQAEKLKQAPLVVVRSQYGHMELVTSGEVIPRLLETTPLTAVR